jgi:hypothetical protein
LSSFPRSERETPLLIDIAPHPLYIFVPILYARRLPLYAFSPVLRARRLPLYAFAPVLRTGRLPFDFAARPLYVFAPALLAHLLLEVVIQDI